MVWHTVNQACSQADSVPTHTKQRGARQCAARLLLLAQSSAISNAVKCKLVLMLAYLLPCRPNVQAELSARPLQAAQGATLGQ